jgi:hypothetical protein
MNRRTHEQIVAECTYAVACCYDHYCDEGLSEDGFVAVREALMAALPHQGSGVAYRESVEESPWAEFRSRIVWPVDWDHIEDYGNTPTGNMGFHK